MTITRRTLLAAGAAGLATVALPSLAGTPVWPAGVTIRNGGRRDYAAAIAAIRAFALAELAATGLPGMTISLVADDGFDATLCLGWADIAARAPVRPDHLFEIGSISKSLVALTLWALAGEGRIDLDAPAARYLPESLLPTEPVTTQQILNHTAGLPNFAPVIPHGPPGRLWTGAKPGTKFYYSNTGYSLAGLLIAAVTGRPHPIEIAERVMRPIGMATASAVITSADRARMAQGYSPLRDDLAPLTGAPLAEGSWGEMDMAAGSVIATPADMAAYLRYVIALGRGRGGPVLGDAAATALLRTSADAPDFGPGARYASGFEKTFIDGRPMLHHTGGMLMFSSSFDVDAAQGVGCFASVNGRLGEYRPVAVTSYAMRLLRAAQAGRKLPDAPDPLAFRRIAGPDRFAGRWIAAEGRALDVRPAGDGLVLAEGARQGRLEAAGATRLIADLPGWDAGSLEFSASGKGKDAPLDRLWYRDIPLARDAAPPAPPPTPDRLRALAGRYRTNDQWVGAMDIVTRGDRLVLLEGGPLVEDRAGYWRMAEDAGGLERLRFDTVVGGRAQRLMLSGNELWRMG